jgi:tetratricopeptide (TPR) repeat protein
MRGPASRLALAAALALAFTCFALPARGDAIDAIGKKLTRLRAETENLRQGIKRPGNVGASTRDRAERRLIEGQVAFGVGNYGDAAVLLYEYVEQHPKSPSYDEALYYLAESLFQKRDYLASRNYFKKLVVEVGGSSKFFQQGLERLIELSLKLSDSKEVDQWLQALDRVPAGKRRSSVPYVRGKYAYFQDRWGEAITHFAQVRPGSEYYFQAQYFLGAAQVAKGDIGAAARTFEDLIERQPKRPGEMRVVELAHMALGRLHYERDQPSRAIDEYTKIARESDLFDEALYEVAWVYVKNSEYDKALRALELLALADPSSSKMPEVRILEGNLRIRKAQNLAGKETGNSAEEYAKAHTLFEATHEAFKEAHDEIARILEERKDPRVFMAQITGRVSGTFEVNATIPEVAASWIRREPDMERVVGIETDLGDIAAEIADAERTITRLERALASPSRVNIFPSLASKRTRATEIIEEIFSMRQQLATHERALVSRHASAAEKKQLTRLHNQRQAAARALAALPNAEVAYGERIERARSEYVALDQKAAEVATVIDATRAVLVALERYVADQVAAAKKPAHIGEIQKSIAELHAEINAMSRELETMRREAEMAKDEAGTGDAAALRARGLRNKLRAALEEEHRYMARIVARMSGGDRSKADKIAALTRTANEVTTRLDQIHQAVDGIVEHALAEVRADLAEEKARLAAYKREFVEYETESNVLGGVILAASFKAVKTRFYDVLIRTNIGVIDVSWSQKEAIDELARRLGLDRIRELRTLRDEFRDILEEGGGNL